MIQAEIKTPNKRKSISNNTPAKKPKLDAKLENGKNVSPKKPFTPKKQNQSPKKNQQASPQVKSEPESPKNVKPFAGTKGSNKGRPKVKKNKNPQNNTKPSPKPQGDGNKKVGKQQKKIKKDGESKRPGKFASLVNIVKGKEGTKDAEVLKKLNTLIEGIKSKGELTKTSKRKLGLLSKLKVICEEGSAVASEKAKAQYAAERDARLAAKALKKAAAPKTDKKPVAVKAQQPKKDLPATLVNDEEDDDEDSDAEEEEDSDVEGEEDDDDEEDSDEEGAPTAPKVSNRKPKFNKKK